MAKLYNLKITKIEDGEETVLHDEMAESLFCGWKCADGKCGEILVNTSIMDIAVLLYSARKLRKASDLAVAMGKVFSEDQEENLIDQIIGGLANG